MKFYSNTLKITAMALCLMVAGCSDSKNNGEDPPPGPGPGPGPGPSPSPSEEVIEEIVNQLEEDEDLSIFTEALKKVDVSDLETEEFTIFAVTNSGITPGRRSASVSPSTDSELAKRHMVAGSYTEEQLKTVSTLTSLSGEKLTVTFDERTGIIHINNVVIGSFKKIGTSTVYTIDEILPVIKGEETFYRLTQIVIPDSWTDPSQGNENEIKIRSNDEERPLWEFFYNSQGDLLKVVHFRYGSSLDTYTFERNSEGQATALYFQSNGEPAKRLYRYTYDSEGRITNILENSNIYGIFRWEGNKLVSFDTYDFGEKMSTYFEYNAAGNINHYYMNHYEGTGSPNRKNELKYSYDSNPNFLSTIPEEWLILTFSMDDLYFPLYYISDFMYSSNNVVEGSYYYINSQYKDIYNMKAEYEFDSDLPYPTWFVCYEPNNETPGDGYELYYRKFVK